MPLARTGKMPVPRYNPWWHGLAEGQAMKTRSNKEQRPWNAA